jgi:hypothetical protein
MDTVVGDRRRLRLRAVRDDSHGQPPQRAFDRTHPGSRLGAGSCRDRGRLLHRHGQFHRAGRPHRRGDRRRRRKRRGKGSSTLLGRCRNPREAYPASPLIARRRPWPDPEGGPLRLRPRGGRWAGSPPVRFTCSSSISRRSTFAFCGSVSAMTVRARWRPRRDRPARVPQPVLYPRARPHGPRLGGKTPANRERRRPDSNRGPLHERTTSEGHASSGGHDRARSRWNLGVFTAMSVDACARPCPG